MIRHLQWKQLLVFLVVLIFPSLLFAEGTKQILTADTGHGKIEVMPSFSDFAWYDANGSVAPQYRLYIHVQNFGEIIYYGFGDVLDDFNNIVTDVLYEIKDPSGNIVVGPTHVPPSGAGYIQTFNQAVAGPYSIAGSSGYNALSYTPTVTGDFYIEFNFNSGTHDRTAFKYFDITVSTPSNVAIDGRVWSEDWQMTTDDYGNHFLGKLFVYSDDGIVTSINFNSMDPFVFGVSCNQYGCYNTGNFTNDRRSVPGMQTLPQYKLFLNNPDPNIYPTGVPGSIIMPVVITPDCSGTANIQVNVTKAGNVNLLLDINPLPGVQPEDVQLSQAVTAGINTITWNGLNGLGQPVPDGQPIHLYVTYINGLTNLPIYDVESNPRGFLVQLVRPSGSDPLTYWDDALVGGTQNLLGCAYSLPTTGCHSWIGDGSSGIGNNNTINTWWYVVSTTEGPVAFTSQRQPFQPGAIIGPASVCKGSSNNIYWINSVGGASSYHWSYSGAGATITQLSDTSISVDFSSTATSGNIVVYGSNTDCGSGPSQSKAIILTSLPGVTLTPYPPVCTSTPAFTLTGGSPAGGTYWIGGTQYTTFDPSIMGAGTFTVTYDYTSPLSSCSAQASQPLVVNALPIVTQTPLANTCVNTTPILLSGGTPAGGIYSGTGVSGGLFTPSIAGAGTFNITYTYTDANSCENSAVQPITVYPLPTITLSAFSNVCITAPSVILSGGSPTGGTYSGPGVISGIFYPNLAGADSVTIWYQYADPNGCTDSTSKPLVISPLPDTPGTIAGTSVLCQESTGVNYSVGIVPNAGSYIWTLAPSTAGTINGNAASVSIDWSASFSGNAGLTVAGVNSCGTGNSSPLYSILVNPKPFVSFIMCTDSITTSDAAIIHLSEGIPLGGTYSGTGVNTGASTFNPALAGVGGHAITYAYTNINNCTNTASRTITVLNPAAFFCGGTFKDVRDNRYYQTVGFGSQCWMAENLNYGIQIASALAQSNNCIPEKYCFNDNSSDCSGYGGLYQWDEMMTYSEALSSQGLCPPGWHIPSEPEWSQLFNNYINNGFAGAPLKASGYSGYNALVQGADFFNRLFDFNDFAGFYWSSSSHGSYKAWAHGMNNPDPSVSTYPAIKSNAFSIRCLKD
jgi:uncharacterized protein (TIGR02145 family)